MKQAFARAVAKNGDVSSQSLIDAIVAERPDLQGQTFYSPHYGNTAHTLIVGDEVFKGPRLLSHMASFEREISYMERLKGKSLPVPELTCVGRNAYFYGMTRLQGVVMSEAMQDMTSRQEDLFAADFGAAVANIALALSDGEEVRASSSSSVRDNDEKYLNNPRIASRLGEDAGTARRLVADYYDRMKERKLVACHADLHKENVLMDPKTRRLTGIIDFSTVSHRLDEEAFSFIGSALSKTAREKMWLSYVAAKPDVNPREFFMAEFLYNLRGMYREREPGGYAERARECIGRLKALDDMPLLKTPAAGGLKC